MIEGTSAVNVLSENFDSCLAFPRNLVAASTLRLLEFPLAGGRRGASSVAGIPDNRMANELGAEGSDSG